MRKAESVKVEKTVSASDTNIKNATGYFDAGNRERMQLEDKIKQTENELTNWIEAQQEANRQTESLKGTLEKNKKKLADIPASSVDEAKVKEVIAALSALPWVSIVHLGRDYLRVTAIPGALKTTFYNQAVYKGGRTDYELLDAPLLLPLPTYDIAIKLSGLGGSRWANSNNLMLRCGSHGEFETFDFEEDMGLSSHHTAHWATNRNAFDWNNVCLGAWEEQLTQAAKEGVVELFNSIALFLQLSGWQGAYTSKNGWAATCGFIPYRLQLRRALGKRESHTSVRDHNRDALPGFLEKFGISSGMYETGSDYSQEQDQVPVGFDVLHPAINNGRIRVSPATLGGGGGGAGYLGVDVVTSNGSAWIDARTGLTAVQNGAAQFFYDGLQPHPLNPTATSIGAMMEEVSQAVEAEDDDDDDADL